MMAHVTESVEGPFRALAGSRKGPFRPIGYTLAGTGADTARVRGELEAAITDDLPAAKPVLLIDSEGGYLAALERELFKNEVLAFLEAEDLAAKTDGRRDDDEELEKERRLRSRLAEAVGGLPDLLSRVDRTLALRENGKFPEPAPAKEEEKPEVPTRLPVASPESPFSKSSPANPAAVRPVPILYVRSFEDLGPDAAAVSETLSVLIGRECHVVVLADGLDTRTREGRVVARATLRLGAIRSGSAQERSKRELEARRRSLKVYGPVPYGYRRDGEELLPVESEQATIEKMKSLEASGRRVAEIVRALNRDRLFWKDGSAWTWRRVSLILKNPLYGPAEKEGRAS